MGKLINAYGNELTLSALRRQFFTLSVLGVKFHGIEQWVRPTLHTYICTYIQLFTLISSAAPTALRINVKSKNSSIAKQNYVCFSEIWYGDSYVQQSQPHPRVEKSTNACHPRYVFACERVHLYIVFFIRFKNWSPVRHQQETNRMLVLFFSEMKLIS